jgi:ARP2/3 complex 16 kDa subunit (p16-Arc)
VRSELLGGDEIPLADVDLHIPISSSSTNMAFRRINIDQYDEDHLPQEDLTPSSPLSDAELSSLVQSTSSQVRSFLQRGDTHSALTVVLTVAPYGPSPAVQQLKVRSSERRWLM